MTRRLPELGLLVLALVALGLGVRSNHRHTERLAREGLDREFEAFSFVVMGLRPVECVEEDDPCWQHVPFAREERFRYALRPAGDGQVTVSVVEVASGRQRSGQVRSVAP